MKRSIKSLDKVYKNFDADNFQLYVEVSHFENLFELCLESDAREFLRLLDTEIRELCIKHNKLINKMSDLNKKDFIKSLLEADSIFALVELKLETFNKCLLDSRRIKAMAA